MIGRRGVLAASAGLLAAAPRLARAAADARAMPAPGKRAWASEIPTLRVGLLGGENDQDRLGRFEAYRALLAKTFEVPVKLFPAADYAGVIQAIAARQIEVAEFGASGFAGAWLETNGNVEPLVVPVEKDGSISYRSVMVVKADSGITSLDDMKGRSLAFADPNSTSGYLIPSFELRRKGIDLSAGKYFSKTGFGGGHEQAVIAVLHGQYDAGCTWASGIGDPAEGYSRGNLHEMVAKGMLKMSDIRIIWTSQPILNGPVTVRRDTPQAFRDDIRDFHLALPAAHRDIYAQIERGDGKGYRTVQLSDFQLFIDLREEEAKLHRQRS